MSNKALMLTFQPILLKNKISLPAKAQSKDLIFGAIRLLSKAFTFLKALIEFFILSFIKNFFTKFIKKFIKIKQA